LPNRLGELLKDLIELSLEDLVETLEAALLAELAGIDRFAVDNHLLFELLTDSLEPFALWFGPGAAGENLAQRRLNSFRMRYKRLAACDVTNVSNDRSGNVLVGCFADGHAEIGLGKTRAIKRETQLP
jgi:hypothetical protein